MHTVTLSFLSTNLSIVSTLGTFLVYHHLYSRKRGGEGRTIAPRSGSNPLLSGFKRRGCPPLRRGKSWRTVYRQGVYGWKNRGQPVTHAREFMARATMEQVLFRYAKKKKWDKNGSPRSGFTRFIGPINSR